MAGDIGDQKLLGYGSLKLIKSSAPYNLSKLYALNNRITQEPSNRQGGVDTWIFMITR